MIDTLAYRRARDDRARRGPGELHALSASRRDRARLPDASTHGAAGVPIALKDVISTQGHRDDRGLEDPRGLRPGLRRDRRRARCKARACPLLGKTNMDEFAMGSSTENSAFGPTRNPWDPERVPGRLLAAARRPRSPAGSRRGRSAPTPAARSSSPPRSAASSACGPPTARSSRYGIVAFASSLDQVGPIDEDGPRLRAASTGSSPAATRATRRRSSCRSPSRSREAEDLKGLRDRRPEGAERGRGHRARRDARRCSRAIELCRELGAEVEECDAAALRRVRPALLLPDRARRRPRRTSPATTASATGTASTARRHPVELYERTRDEGFGDEPKRRIMLGTYALSAGYYDAFYGQAQKVRTIIRDEHAALFERFDVLVSPDLADGRLPARREDGEPARDVPLRRAHDPAEHGGPARPLDPVRALGGPARGLQLIGPAVLGEPALPRRPRAGAGARLRLRPGAPPVKLGTGHRPRDPRPPEDADEDVLPLRARVLRAARTRARARSASRIPGALPVPNGRAIEMTVLLGLASAARSPSERSSTASTTSIPTCPRATRSPSTTSRSAWTGG